MQKLRTHLSWINSSRQIKASGIFAALLFVLFGYAGLTFGSGLVSDIHAQSAAIDTAESPTPSQTPQTTPAPAEPAQETPAPVVAVAPTPAPAPKPAPTPAPAYDKVTIPGIGLSSKYVSVGLTSTNAIDVHPKLVGLYTGRAQPGQPGAVFLDGHNPGVFSKLPSITVGSIITITKASGEVFNYTVVYTETVQLIGINMGKALSPYPGYTEGLNLMTCVGTYNASTGTTDQRFVVYAVRS